MADAVAGPSTSKAAPSSTSAALLSLHPLPILSISEHIVRSCAQQQQGKEPLHVYGVLLGTQNGRHLEVQNTFEVKVDVEGKLDEAFFKSRQAQYKQTFPTLDLLGWYSNGNRPTSADVAVHKQFLEYNESPLFLQFSPNADILARRDGRGQLPIQVYESQMAVTSADQPIDSSNEGAAPPTASSDEPSTSLILVESNGYRIETAEAERIAVDYVSKPAGAQGSEGEHGAVISSLESQQSAIRMLHARIKMAHGYVTSLLAKDAKVGGQQGVTAGANGSGSAVGQRDHEALRQLKSILSSMPRAPPANAAMQAEEDDDGFRTHFLREYNDALLISSLSRMTAGMRSLNEYVDKFDLIQQGRGGDRERRDGLESGGRGTFGYGDAGGM
ncbi:hypothetical protein BDZ90DRAFT_276364 [Jaminaea rosea]|uniref:COP9 signalosome complex subunit 6 n=1 Tax=Jaminaea rosea TaxID=1569628 RepID=A0A316UH03_9BASI|nr:hypothetical protein BDZ90DRAFT_276364 [Jaminaea rosea]PWN24470.1 hypothetical protein BDZ90DRAFT_276364 [Jaminaea rosea]